MKEVVCVTLLFSILAGANLQVSTTLEGTVVIAEEDNDFNTVAIDLLVDNNEDDRIEKSTYSINLKAGKGKELLKKVYEKVKVTGIVKSDKAGSRQVTILDYQVIAVYEEDLKKPGSDEVLENLKDSDEIQEED